MAIIEGQLERLTDVDLIEHAKRFGIEDDAWYVRRHKLNHLASLIANDRSAAPSADEGKPPEV